MAGPVLRRRHWKRQNAGFPMIAFGCLLLIVLPLIGLAVGGYVAGGEGAAWAAVAGLVIAIAVCGVSAAALVKAGRQR